jgi:uncharacterized protein (DUF1778 family)
MPYAFIPYKEAVMPRTVIESNSRLDLRIRSQDKAVIQRAAQLENTDLTNFILRAVLPAARAVIERAERIELSERDSLYVLDLLEHPPQPNERLLRAAQALPEAP